MCRLTIPTSSTTPRALVTQKRNLQVFVSRCTGGGNHRHWKRNRKPDHNTPAELPNNPPEWLPLVFQLDMLIRRLYVRPMPHCEGRDVGHKRLL